MHCPGQLTGGEKRDREMAEETPLQVGTENMGDNGIGGTNGIVGTSEVVGITIKTGGTPDDIGTGVVSENPTEERMRGDIGTLTEIWIKDDSCLLNFLVFISVVFRLGEIILN